ncbi:MAG: hypothetical protein AB8G86_06030 [Saprospiraceae bacterium]
MANKRIINHQTKITEIEQAIYEGKGTKKVLQKMMIVLPTATADCLLSSLQ